MIVFFGLPPVGAVLQVQDIGLDVRQQVFLRGGREQRRLRFLPVAGFLEEQEEIPPQLPHRGEQAIASLQVQLLRLGSPFAGALQRLLLLPHRTDVAPELLAGLQEVKAHLDVAGQRGEDPQVKGRQRRDSEDGNPLRQARNRAGGLLQVLDEPGLQRRRMLLAERGADLAPQLRLPVLVGSRLPLPDQVGPEDQVLIEHVGDAVCQLEQLPAVAALPPGSSSGLQSPAGPGTRAGAS